ncbi:MAG: alkaline phosphatase family protein [Candidatus Cybelea sp.]
MRCNGVSIFAGFALCLSACNGANSGLSAAPGSQLGFQPPRPGVLAPLHGRRPSSNGKIQHVVIIIQENRSLNNLFYGFPGAKTVKYGYNTRNEQITLQPVPLEDTWDVQHDSYGFFAACNGTGSIPGTNCQMNGFNNEGYTCGGSGEPRCPNDNPPYGYVPHSETKPYFAMGKQYVLADQMYASNLDASSFVSHQYIIAAQAESSANYPAGYWGCPGGSGDSVPTIGPQRQFPYGSEVPCWDPTTLGDELDNAGLSWGYYTATVHGDEGIWNAYQAIQHVYYGYDWGADIITPQTQFFSDVSNGNLRAVSWITPTLANSDHAGSGSNTGPQWVASLVNAIGQSQYWNSTAIFIFWDDYGGWYDPEPPAYVDYDGLGIRIPMLIVSAYARKGHVSHVHYEHGSILKFVEDLFGLGRLSASDARANSPKKDCFNFKKPPRPFTVIPTVLGKEYFMHQPSDHRAPDPENAAATRSMW